MDIQFRCNNISEFDSTTGQYVYCEQLLQAESRHIGLRVRCPKCQQTTTVPSLEVAAATTTNGQSRRQNESAETVEFDQPHLDYSRFDKKVRCPKCGSLLDEEKRCTACRYVMPVINSHRIPLDKIKVKPAGFQLWIMSIFSDGISPKVFEATAHALFAFTMILGLLAGIALGGSNLPLVIGFLALITGFYALVVMKTRQLATKPATKLPFYMKPFWNLILRFARSMDWQKYDSMLQNRKIIDVRGQDFGDRELLGLSELSVCQVLDAEGTHITDHGLATMHGLKHLRCLVVRKTNVSVEGVFRLQQALPKCWIWY